MTQGNPSAPIDRPLLVIAAGCLLTLAFAGVLVHYFLTLADVEQIRQLALAGTSGFVLLVLVAALGLAVLRRRVLRSKRDLAGSREREHTGLAEHRQMMTSLLEQTQEGFWFTDMDSRTTEVNPAMCAMLGCSRVEVLGKEIFAFVDTDNAQIVRTQIEARRQGKLGRYRLQLRRPDESLLPCLVRASPTYDAQGALTGSIGLRNHT